MSPKRAVRAGSRRTRRRSILWWGLGALSVAMGVVVAATVSGPDAHGQEITVHKTATCGCCSKWIGHLEKHGFRVTVNDVHDLRAVRESLGIPSSLLSCHSAELAGYVVEGHVPAGTLIRVMDERPDVAGVAVPGMPGSAPGMEVGPRTPYNVVAFDRAGGLSVFERR